MSGLQLLKFCQHESLLKQLLDTADLPLEYAQATAPGQASVTQVLDSFATQLAPDATPNARYGDFGKPLPPSWSTLQHPDDVFWGTDPLDGPKGNNANQLCVHYYNL